MLWLALAGRDAGVRCSELLEIRSKTAALDFDLACAYQLLKFENKREFERLQAQKDVMKAAIVEALGGGENEPQQVDKWSNISENDVM